MKNKPGPAYTSYLSIEIKKEHPKPQETIPLIVGSATENIIMKRRKLI
jgi:hypothetical protein